MLECVTKQSQVLAPPTFLTTAPLQSFLFSPLSSEAQMLKLQGFNYKTHDFHTFSYFSCNIRNNFPQDIRHSATLSSFKAKPKTFLFTKYFT